VGHYLGGNTIADPNTKDYYLFLDANLLPGLIMRYTALDESVVKPVIETSGGYNIDLSMTQELLREILSSRGEINIIFPMPAIKY
jgi:hypothetical protein